MAALPKLNCIAFADCWFKCLDASSSATSPSCIAMCKPQEKSPQTPGLFIGALTCGQLFCLGELNGDAGAGVCSTNVMGQYVNHDNTPAFDSKGLPQGDCGECLNDASQKLLSALAVFEGQMTGAPCIGTRFCNPAVCQSEVNACVNDPAP
jgi:hypothetical protein